MKAHILVPARLIQVDMGRCTNGAGTISRREVIDISWVGFRTDSHSNGEIGGYHQWEGSEGV
jgi:hypothetical protein